MIPNIPAFVSNDDNIYLVQLDTNSGIITAENEPRVVGAPKRTACVTRRTDGWLPRKHAAQLPHQGRDRFLADLTVRSREGQRACARGTLCPRSGDFPLGINEELVPRA